METEEEVKERLYLEAKEKVEREMRLKAEAEARVRKELAAKEKAEEKAPSRGGNLAGLTAGNVDKKKKTVTELGGSLEKGSKATKLKSGGGQITGGNKNKDLPTKKKSGIVQPRPYTDRAKVSDVFKKKPD